MKIAKLGKAFKNIHEYHSWTKLCCNCRSEIEFDPQDLRISNCFSQSLYIVCPVCEDKLNFYNFDLGYTEKYFNSLRHKLRDDKLNAMSLWGKLSFWFHEVFF